MSARLCTSFVSVLALSLPQLASAQDALGTAKAVADAGASAGSPELFTAGYLVQVLGSLLVVFVCLFAVIFLLKRFNRIGSGSGSALRIIASASLGQREKVVLLETGGEQLLLGVAPGNVRMLHVLAERVDSADGGQNGGDSESSASAASFADVLRAANPLGKTS